MPKDECHQAALMVIGDYKTALANDCHQIGSELFCNSQIETHLNKANVDAQSAFSKCHTWQIAYLEDRFNQYHSSVRRCWVPKTYDFNKAVDPQISTKGLLAMADMDLAIQMILES
uniref:Uncharacterized protein n=1 Tax=Strombidium rassoulzadegani TaxID=1082188 RepID=A0A7S3CMY7_9SPIT|mmetsp:Transcript_17585/g.29685  ORF Transcript_17585/g.29685 Transcript_17585/m.29685 type:complete len:116 (+) Transcript_17585:181-528(+)